jgi:hypothetical protein
MAFHKTCDGVGRRDFLKVGAIGASALTLSNWLRFTQAGEVTKNAKAKAAVFINLEGGPSHMDSFDLKPDSPSEYRGEFNPIDTNVAGIRISEHLPKLAQVADKFCLLRGITHALGAHALGQQYVATGNRPLASLQYPTYGSVVAKEFAPPEDLPPFVAVPNSKHGAGFLGVKYAALNTGATPKPGQPFSVRGVSLQGELTVAEVEKRNNLLADLDKTFQASAKDELIEGLDKFGQQAHAMITSKKAREAFDVGRESADFQKMYGESGFGMSCLLATRLVEAGVPFISVSLGGWDTHNDNWTRLKTRQLPPLDDGLSGLLRGLELRGLLDSTAVYVTGEFGRTPKINTTRGGRDHYPRNMFMLMAGGGVKGGQVIGQSDDKGTFPEKDGHSPDDVAASFYHALGIDHTKEYQTSSGRPITIVRDGHIIREMFA